MCVCVCVYIYIYSCTICNFEETDMRQRGVETEHTAPDDGCELTGEKYGICISAQNTAGIGVVQPEEEPMPLGTLKVLQVWEHERLCMLALAAQLCPTLRPHGLQPARLLCPWGFSTQESWSGLPCPPPGNLPNPRIEPRSPTLQADSLPSAPPGKFKTTGVGSLSLLHGIFLTRESDRVLLHCRRILYQLSYQGSPEDCATGKIFSP